ncbi:MAG TPA: YraN family protein [Thermomicrobiaceae bacterium]|nr:YraN family protein [Thermomicrobiaceae bacterium]
MTGRRKTLGNAGERLAARHLEDQGLRIIDRQWRGKAGEIDLAALDGETLVIVEVKTRRGRRFGDAEEAVDEAKSERLLALGEEYTAAHPEHRERFWRVDLVAITLGTDGSVVRLTHLPDACRTG